LWPLHRSSAAISSATCSSSSSSSSSSKQHREIRATPLDGSNNQGSEEKQTHIHTCASHQQDHLSRLQQQQQTPPQQRKQRLA
jgi:hypothetical protein